MFKILLVESEPEAVKILSTYIRNYSSEPDEIIHVTDAGVLAQKAEQNRPALVIADAGFFADCAETVKGLYERCPDVKVVLYAAIGQSEQIQRCLEYGLLDYMYKPVKHSEFLRCLQRAIDHFKLQDKRRNEDSRMLKAYQAKAGAYEQIFIRALLNGQLREPDEIMSGFRYFKMGFVPDYTVLILNVDRNGDMDLQGRCLLAFKIKTLAAKIFSNDNFRMCQEDFSSIIIILSGIGQEQAAKTCQRLKDSINESLETRVSIGLGASYKNPADISASFREARTALKYRPIMGYDSVLPIGLVEAAAYSYPEDSEQRFIDSAVVGAYEGCLAELGKITEAFDGGTAIGEAVLDILTSISRRTAQRGIRIPESWNVQGIRTPGDAYEYLKSSARSICGFITKARAEADAALAAKAKDYITQHYYEAPSAARLAAILGTTGEYFERVFSEREGVGVAEFTARIRLEEAKRLIRKTAMDDELIAVKIGYDDSKQFRGEFRDYEGMSVREYRVMYNALD